MNDKWKQLKEYIEELLDNNNHALAYNQDNDGRGLSDERYGNYSGQIEALEMVIKKMNKLENQKEKEPDRLNLWSKK